MADTSALLITPETHPFQLQDLPSPKGPYDITQMNSGFFVRLDMPGVPQSAIKIFKRPEKMLVTFNATAPKKESFPYDESERVYAGVVKLNKNPNDMLIDVIAENGSVILLFPYAQGHLIFMPQPKSRSTSSGKSIDYAQGSENSKHDERSDENCMDNGDGCATSARLGEGTSNEYAEEGSAKSQQDESLAKTIDEATVWMHTCIKKHILKIGVPGSPEEPSSPVRTSPKQPTSHEVPEIAIGSVEEMGIHGPLCQCENCDSDGICLKTWSTTEDNFRNINKLKIKGPDGVFEKKVVQDEGGSYSLYLRVDLPGLEPEVTVRPIRERGILVFGQPQPLQRYEQGARNYLFFVNLQCSCCNFESDNIIQDYEDGVLRLFCRIIPTGSSSSC